MSGAVTLDDKPAPPGLRIDFMPQVANRSPSTGFTDDQGRYVMMFNTRKTGVLPGESLVRISIPFEIGQEGKPVAPEHLRKVKLPDSVGGGSTLRKTVKPGHNTIDIEVASEPEPRGR